MLMLMPNPDKDPENMISRDLLISVTLIMMLMTFFMGFYITYKFFSCW